MTNTGRKRGYLSLSVLSFLSPKRVSVFLSIQDRILRICGGSVYVFKYTRQRLVIYLVKPTLPMFPDPFFGFVFVLVIVLAVIITIVSIIRAFKSAGNSWSTASTMPQTVREKEIIREIIKIRCPYCGSLYDETENKCPNCGGNKT